MCTCLPSSIPEAFNTFENGAVYVGRVVYAPLSSVALYILTIYETLGGWIGVASAEIASMGCRVFFWIQEKRGVLGGVIGLGCAQSASLALRCSEWIYNKVGHGAGLMGLAGYYTGLALHATALATLRGLCWVADKGRSAARLLGGAIYRVCETIGGNIASAVRLTTRFIRANWTHVLAHLFAWAAVITCSGIIYGFERVALPLTIGFGCGLVFGGLTGILTTKIFDHEDHYRGRNTAWDGLNYYLLDRLPSAGVKTVLLSLSVTVLLAAAVVYPYAMGALFGVLMGNHATSLISFGRDLSHLNREQELNQLRTETQNLLERIRRLENHD